MTARGVSATGIFHRQDATGNSDGAAEVPQS
jgi:hypothetical protein